MSDSKELSDLVDFSDQIVRLTWICLMLDVIYGCAILYYTVIFALRVRYENSKDSPMNEFITRRRPKLMLFFLALGIFYLIIAQPLLLILAYVESIRNGMTTLWGFSILGMIHIQLWRAWMLYYDQNVSRASSNLTWRQELDDGAEERDWYLSHRNTYGSLRWLLKYFLSFWLISCAILISVERFVKWEWLYHGCEALLMFIPTVGMILIYCRLPKITDYYAIRKELKYSAFVFFSAIIVFLICNFVLQSSNARYFLRIMLSTHVVFICCAITSFGILRVAHNRAMRARSSRKHADMSGTDVSEAMVDMLAVLMHLDGFEAFMLHLTREFASESLLFLIDLMEYKRSFLDHPLDAIQGFEVKLPRDMKCAKILERIDDPFEKACHMWDKYLKEDAQLQINLSSAIRQKLEMYFEKGLLQDTGVIRNGLPFLFDDSGECILSLLSDSFLRFIHTPQFIRFKKVVMKRMKEPSMLERLFGSLPTQRNIAMTDLKDFQQTKEAKLAIEIDGATEDDDDDDE